MFDRCLVPVAVLCLVAGAPAQANAEEVAMAELMKAEEAAAKAQYTRAVAIYKRTAKEWPQTTAGKVASGRSQATAFLGSADLVRHGKSDNRLDVVVMGDGYRIGDQSEFDDIAKTIPKLFRKHKLLGEYYSYHNFIRANLRSKDQGVSGHGRVKDTALGGHIAGEVQGQVGVDVGRAHGYLREVEGSDGYAIAIVKAGSMGTGGAGIAAIGGRADDTIIHEWGHAFAGLSDEYTTFTGHRGTARNTINLSTSEDPKLAPWKHFIEKKVPGVGTYRGGGGQEKGVWRPTASGCAMAGGVIFCPVCREAIVKRIYRHVDPIDGQSPEVGKKLSGRGPFRFTVEVLKPETHGLAVRWYVLGGNERVRVTGAGPFKDRRRRGALAEVSKKPERTVRSASRSTQTFTLNGRRMEPGTYQVLCRVEDQAKPRGQKYPWVLNDPDQLLWSERAWTVEVR